MSLDPLAVEMMDFAERLAEARTLDDVERCCVRGVRRLIPLPAAGLVLLEPGTDRTWRRATVGVSEFFLSRYERLGRARDPVFAEVQRTHRTVSSRALMSEDRWREQPAYEEMHRLHRMTLCIQAPVLAGSELIGTLNAGGSDDTPHPEEERIALLEPMGRMVGAAVQAALARAEEERRNEHAHAALSLSDEAIVVSDVRTGDRTANEAAERLLGRVHERSSDCMDRLLSNGDGTLPAVRTERVLLRDDTTATLRARVATRKRRPDIIVCFLELVDPNTDVGGNGLDHWLTERERAVAQRVARGMRDSEIAAELHLSQHTVRDHVKSIYRKTGATNRVELTRMVLLGEAGDARARAAE